MTKKYLFIVFWVIFKEVMSQTLDDSTSSVPILIQNFKKSGSTNAEWEELLPQLQMIKNTPKIKKEKLYKVIKIIKYLLSEEMEDKETKNLEEVKKLEPELLEMPDIDSIVEDRLKPIKEVIEDQSFMLDTAKENNETVKNSTDFSQIFTKIAKALAKLKEQKPSEKTPTMVPIFRSRNGCRSDLNPPIETSKFDSSMSRTFFDIPCQRASDILDETANFPLPKEVFCDNPNVNLKSLAKNTKLNLDNLPFKNIVPNSITCVDSDDSIAILFKPKNVSLMQMYGNLLKKITITVLVPYYVSKLAL